MLLKSCTISLLYVLLLGWQTEVAIGQGFCGGTLMKAFGYLTSPNHPNYYNHDTDCSWIIRAARGHKITFKVLDFQLENHRSCKKDYLAIYDGPNMYSPLIGRHCGNKKPFLFTSTSNQLYIRFKTDSNNEYKGFRAVFNSSLDCGGTYRGRHGLLASPNSPNNYYSSSDCVYKIIVPIGNIVKVKFTEFHLESARFTGQCYDYVKVHDGDTVFAPSLGKFCGDHSPFTIKSTSQVILIQFISDKSINKKGFRLVYNAEAQSVPTTQPRVTTPPLVPSTCLSTEFRCSNGKCIDLRWKCDRQDDCGDLSDENGCPCRRYQFQCDNGRCQDRIWVCDGTDDCGDGSDERNCSTTPTSPSSAVVSCCRNNGGCEHTCIQSIIRGSMAARCQCKPGYKLQSDGKSCTDINECQQSNKTCDHRCLNIPGSYVCACRIGYHLALDKRTCKA